jgi:lipooligosaccharide transport system permease protein
VVAKIAFFTPLYHIVNIFRSFANGNIQNVIWDIVWVLAAAAILAPYPFRLMRRRIIK